MLSNTDIHYIAAFLYAADGKPPTVTLGARLHDAAADEKRDVDIAIVENGHFGIIAAEVKNHKRPLDVTLVEGLCRKLADMPSVSSRAIVSSSGYTEPARRKAAWHGVSCLTLVRGPLPSFHTVDISKLRHVTIDDTDWVGEPKVLFEATIPLSNEQQERLRDKTVFSFGSFELTRKEVVQQIREQFDLQLLNLAPGTEIAVDFSNFLAAPAKVKVGRHQAIITGARLSGTVRRTRYRLPIAHACYLANEENEPFAATLVFELNDRLIGITSSAHGFSRRVFHISAPARRGRPHQVRLL